MVHPVAYIGLYLLVRAWIWQVKQVGLLRRIVGWHLLLLWRRILLLNEWILLRWYLEGLRVVLKHLRLLTLILTLICHYLSCPNNWVTAPPRHSISVCHSIVFKTLHHVLSKLGLITSRRVLLIAIRVTHHFISAHVSLCQSFWHTERCLWWTDALLLQIIELGPQLHTANPLSWILRQRLS